jgi:hypothetical protein
MPEAKLIFIALSFALGARFAAAQKTFQSVETYAR